MTRLCCPVNDFRIKIFKLISIRDMKVILSLHIYWKRKNIFFLKRIDIPIINILVHVNDGLMNVRAFSLRTNNKVLVYFD